MSHIAPEYSVTRVDVAGAWLRSEAIEGIEIHPEYNEKAKIAFEHFRVLYNWRAAHTLPMSVIRGRLSALAKEEGVNALIVQRLKRIASITFKLERFSTRLSKMQDIGGCRAIVDTVSDVRRLSSAMRDCHMQSNLIREKDYIDSPKEDGYRGIHQVFNYQSKEHPLHNGLNVEVQIRSKLQHAWATGVETVDTLTKDSIKLGGGQTDWREFFVLASSFFSEIEGCPTVAGTPVGRDLRKKLVEAIDRMEILARLSSFQQLMKFATDPNESTSKAHYFLLVLDPVERLSRIHAFTPSRAKEAVKVYDAFEREQAEHPEADAVLVRSESLKDLKKAYPNYFADTSFFLEVLVQRLGYTEKVPGDV